VPSLPGRCALGRARALLVWPAASGYPRRMSMKPGDSGTWSPDSLDGTTEGDALTEPGASEPLPARYTMVGMLGKGGMGEVWRVQDDWLSRQVAMKVVSQVLCQNATAMARFREEAQATARLEHPGIVPVYDVGMLGDGRLFYTMKEVHGRTLRVASKERPGPAVELLDALADVCGAVGYAHQRRVLHRDLKPDNILLGDFGEVLVLDWGLVKILDRAELGSGQGPATGPTDSGLTMAGQVAGTPGFMSPEQREGRIEDLTPASDVYALGAILYGMLHGGAPAADTPAPPEGPAELVALTMDALNPNPADRPPDASAFGARLRQWLEGERREARFRVAEDSVDESGREILLRLMGPQGEASTCPRAVLDELGLGTALRALEEAGILTGEETVRMMDPGLVQWPLLAAWRAADGRVRPLLRDAVLGWKTEGEPAHLLWAGPALEDAEAWVRRVQPRLVHAERGFLEASSMARRRSVNRRRWAIAAALVFLVGVSVVLGVLLRQARVAEAEAVAARHAEHVRSVLAEAGTHRAEGRPYAEVALYRAALDLDADNAAAQAGVDRFLARGDTLQVLERHDGTIQGMARTPDGVLLTSGADGRFVITAPDGTQKGVLETGGVDIDKVVLSPDGRRAVGIARDVNATFWDVESGEKLGTWGVGESRLMDAGFSSDGERVVLVEQHHQVQVRRTATGEALWTVVAGMFASFTSDDRHIVSAGWNGGVFLQDAETGQPVSRLELGDHPVGLDRVGERVYISMYSGLVAVDEQVTRVFWHREGGSVFDLVPVGADTLLIAVEGRAEVVDAETGETRAALSTGDAGATALAVLDAHVAVGDGAGRVHLWERGSWRKVGVYDGHNGSVLNLVWSQGALWVGTSLGTVWEMRPAALQDPVLHCAGGPAKPGRGGASGHLRLLGERDCVRLPDGGQLPVQGELLGVSESGALALTWQDGEARLLALPSGEVRNRWDFPQDGDFVAGAVDETSVWLAQARYSGKLTAVMGVRRAPLDGELGEPFMPPGSVWWWFERSVLIGMSMRGDEVMRWGEPLVSASPPLDGRGRRSADLTPSGHRQAVSWRPGIVVLYDAALQTVAQWEVAADTDIVAVHPAGELVATGGAAGSVQLLRPGDDVAEPFAEFGESVLAMAFSASGDLLAISGKQVGRVFETKSGALVREVPFVGRNSRALSFAGDAWLVMGQEPVPERWVVRSRVRTPDFPRLSVCRGSLAIVVGEEVWSDCP
jgi:WD40 repeat protein